MAIKQLKKGVFHLFKAARPGGEVFFCIGPNLSELDLHGCGKGRSGYRSCLFWRGYL